MESVVESVIETVKEYIYIDHDSCSKIKCNVKGCTFCQANFCVSCGENMGEDNPRQYCCKTYCPYE